MPTYTTNYSLIKPNVNDAVDEDLWGGYQNTSFDTIDAAIKSVETSISLFLPKGVIIPYAGTSTPSRWLFCYGQAIDRTTYSDLFTVIGTAYGSGDGSTTFNLPDLRGRIIAGKDNMGGTSADRLTGLSGGVDGDTLGATGGEQSHQLTLAEVAKHQHLIIGNAQSGGGTPSNTSYLARSSNQASGNNDYGLQTTSTVANIGLTSENGGDTAHNNVQPTIIVNYIIYAGV